VRFFFKGKLDYLKSLEEMECVVQKIVNGELEEQIWFLEYDNLYTFGSGEQFDIQHINSVPAFKTNRGGKITYHGPGQIIIYFMINLKRFFNPEQPDIARFIFLLEQIIVDALNEVGLNANRLNINHGAWINNNKICAIGIRLKKWISYHGLALNFDTNLDFYNYIAPCGLDSRYGVTSIYKELPFAQLKKENFINILINSIKKVF
jgi:lipoyl(octanoyl) transferase